MRITIDNLEGRGAVDYTSALDGTVAPQLVREINQPSKFSCSLLGSGSGFIVPVAGSRVAVTLANGDFIFSGYLTAAAECEYLGSGEAGAVYRYGLTAESDEVLLDAKVLPNRAPFVLRSAGSALRQLANDLLPGGFDLSAVQDLDVLAAYAVNPQKKFSDHAADIAMATRGCYRAMNGALIFAPVGTATYAIEESDATFCPAGLKLSSPRVLVNDVTLIGLDEPQAYVRDYFVGDGLSLRFYLSQRPFQQNRTALIDEQFAGPGLDAATWVVNDPTKVVSVAAQALQVGGGSGDGATTVSFSEQIELGGALELQHGDVSFSAASQGVIGGLYAGSISAATCLAGFQVMPSGTESKIQALINGTATGAAVTTKAGHHYVLTTYVYSMEVYRSGEKYHSSVHEAGNGLGGAAIPADVRIVLELQDVDPAVPASMVAPATVLYDDVIPNAPGFCTYALMNAADMQCSIASTYVTHISTALVRMALPDSHYTTQLVESLADGGQCGIVSSTTLDFYPQYVPPLNALIVASYRGSGRAVAEVINSEAIAALQSGTDDGVRGMVRTMKAPSARTQADCENATLAILDDGVGSAWLGTYKTWSDFLPGGASDIFPGDGVGVDVPSRNAAFTAIVRKVAVDWRDAAGDRGMYSIDFANDLAEPLAREDQASATRVPLQDLAARLATTEVGSYYLASLTGAEVAQISSTTVQVDAGIAPGTGLAIEVRAHDFGWGSGNDRNLLGRFTTRTFSLPRLARSQAYFLRLYDSSSRYSRYAAALHVDYPL
ncbi:MAG TPA: hypothetical protein VGS78_15460 [Candidatus Sulfotelmatobacter sp.]|nr:hypothetical protein [Candidatus Sulfotelmatobacter sp.]